MNAEKTPKFTPGTKYQGRNGIESVVDILTKRNLAGGVVHIRYITERLYCGQPIHYYDVLETTIAKNLIEETRQ